MWELLLLVAALLALLAGVFAFTNHYLVKKRLKDFDGTLLRDRMRFSWIYSWILGPVVLALSWQDLEKPILALVCGAAATPIVYLYSIRYIQKRLQDGVMRYKPEQIRRQMYWAIPIFGIIFVAEFFWSGSLLSHPLFVGLILSWPLSAPFIWFYVRNLEHRLGKDIWESSK